MQESYIPLETQSQANTTVTPSETEGSKGKEKRHSEGLITDTRCSPIATQRNRKPQTSASIQCKPTLTTCKWKIKIMNPVVTSKGKLPKSVDRKFVQATVKEAFASKGTSQRAEKALPEPEDLEEDTLDTVVDGKTLREIIPTFPFKFQFNRNSNQRTEDMDQVLQLHQLLKDHLQWSIDNKRFNLASNLAQLGESCQKICLKEMDFKELMVITKGWNPTRKVRLLEVRANRIRENKATIQAMKEQLTQTGHAQIASGSQGVGQTSSLVASHHSGTNRLVEKSHHFSQSQVVSRRRQGYVGQKQDLFEPKAERVRHNDPEAVGLGERSTQ
ncbi:hypothetical protein O181_028582 [Austropuccinia psidii MF-1]|uniref:Uncharacterized protein n=1 Tax=Austropuccinia psidii MF-1 TaxID=1389203 RepID=A0A9Q3CUW1_9BASI|nr:hypothetical protein [Austropuccinia psidii MF-1]